MAAPFTASAKDRDGPPTRAAQIVDELNACRTIAVDAERLACFDRTAAALATARADKQLTVVDREDVKETKKSLFGFSLPKLNLFAGKGEDDGVPEIKELDATITAVRAIQNALFVITLDNGQQWQFIDPMTFPPKAGDPIHIKRGALSAYFGSVKGRTGVKLKRIG